MFLLASIVFLNITAFTVSHLVTPN